MVAVVFNSLILMEKDIITACRMGDDNLFKFLVKAPNIGLVIFVTDVGQGLKP